MKTTEVTDTTHRSGDSCHFLRDDRAVSALEYAMVVGILAVILSAALVTFSDSITDVLATIGTEVGTQTIGTTTKLE